VRCVKYPNYVLTMGSLDATNADVVMVGFDGACVRRDIFSLVSGDSLCVGAFDTHFVFLKKCLRYLT
jgi:hypothetical protein